MTFLSDITNDKPELPLPIILDFEFVLETICLIVIGDLTARVHTHIPTNSSPIKLRINLD